MTAEVRAHPVEWTPDRVQRFWDFYSSNPALADSYFTRMVGRSLLAFVGRRIEIGAAIDIGCGRGDLVALLLERGSDVFGADSSPSSLEALGRFKGSPGFRGAVPMGGGTISLAGESVDTAFLVEVVEHMDDDALGRALTEAGRVLRRGGHVVITTPNEENLDAGRTMCPECGCVFHRVQHVRAWSAAILRAYLERFGFDTVACEATVLSPHTGALDALYRLAYPLVRGRRPHLVYIGRKVG